MGRRLLRVASWQWLRGSPRSVGREKEEPSVEAALQEVLGTTSPISVGMLLVGVGALLAGLGSLLRGIDRLVEAQEKLRVSKE